MLKLKSKYYLVKEFSDKDNPLVERRLLEIVVSSGKERKVGQKVLVNPGTPRQTSYDNLFLIHENDIVGHEENSTIK